MNLPSGEKLDPCSRKRVLRNTVGLWPPEDIDNNQRLVPPGGWLLNERNAPSGDQSSALFASPEASSSSSWPVPDRFFTYRSRTPLRFDVNAIREPSGAQTGLKSSAGSKVMRVLPPRTRSKAQISRVSVCGSRIPTANRLPSGDRAGFEYSAGS